MTVWKSIILETRQSEASHLQGAFSVSTRHCSSNAIWLLLNPVLQFSSSMTRQSAGPDKSRRAPKQHGPSPCRTAPGESAVTDPVYSSSSGC